jgi:hypothetical protein
MNKLPISVIVLAIAVSAGASGAEAPLILDQTIALDDVSGRIDHMAIDPDGKRLFVAELGNGTVDVVDPFEPERSSAGSAICENRRVSPIFPTRT